MSRRRKQQLPQTPSKAVIESLSPEGRGVAHVDGKATFISGALPGEEVLFVYTRRKRSHQEGKAVEVLVSSSGRVEPACPHFEVCGGCSLQHLDPNEQVAFKQQSMMDSLRHLGKVEPQTLFEPITAEPWGYRRKARLGVKYVAKKGKVLVGFREREGRFLADIEACRVLHPSVGERLQELQALILPMQSRSTTPQIEIAVGDNATALIVRHLEPLSEADQSLWIRFARQHDIQLYLQPKGPDTVHCLWPENPDLYYDHADFDVRIHFGPQDFFQVNTGINRQMVPRAVELLKLSGEERVLDLFCGLGNFTLPIARQAAQVTGVEGDITMVRRARETALANKIENTDYFACNLMGSELELKSEPWLKQSYDRILLDPPRSGAKEIMPFIGKLGASRIVYVSCNPATLARDAGELVHSHGYTLKGAGIMDMFPHTAHVETIALFER